MKTLTFFLALLISVSASAQMDNPVSWSTSVKKVEENQYDLIIVAQIESGWHLYAQDIPSGGPVPSSFSFETQGNDFKLVGKTREEKGLSAIDKVFGMKIK